MVKVKDAFNWYVGGVKPHYPNTFFYLMDYSNHLKNISRVKKNQKSLLSFKDLISTALPLKGMCSCSLHTGKLQELATKSFWLKAKSLTLHCHKLTTQVILSKTCKKFENLINIHPTNTSKSPMQYQSQRLRSKKNSLKS